MARPSYMVGPIYASVNDAVGQDREWGGYWGVWGVCVVVGGPCGTVVVHWRREGVVTLG